MRDYSIRRNLSYMAMAFSRPKQLIDAFLKETSFLYSIFPLILFTILFEIAYVLDYLFGTSGFFHILADILGIPDIQYNLYQIFLFPIVHIVDFLVFGGVIYALSRLLRLYKVNTIKSVFFFMFIWNTIGLLGFITENLAAWWKLDFLLYAQPIYLMIYLLYSMEFFHKQAEITRRKSLVLSVASVIVFILFRMIFLG